MNEEYQDGDYVQTTDGNEGRISHRCVSRGYDWWVAFSSPLSAHNVLLPYKTDELKKFSQNIASDS